MVEIGVSLEEDMLDNVEERSEMSDYEGMSDRGALELEIGVEGRLRTRVA